MEQGVQLDDRVLIRAELVQVKQERQAHDEERERLDLATGKVIRKARDLGVSMEEAASLAGLNSRTTGYKLVGQLEVHEREDAGA